MKKRGEDEREIKKKMASVIQTIFDTVSAPLKFLQQSSAAAADATDATDAKEVAYLYFFIQTIRDDVTSMLVENQYPSVLIP